MVFVPRNICDAPTLPTLSPYHHNWHINGGTLIPRRRMETKIDDGRDQIEKTDARVKAPDSEEVVNGHYEHFVTQRLDWGGRLGRACGRPAHLRERNTIPGSE